MVETSTVLLVDDEPVVREAMARLLKHLGCRVFDTYNGANALRLLDQHPEITHLLSDIYMAGMSGFELALEVRRRRPDLRVILTSGQQAQPPAEFSFLAKPWRAEELRSVIAA